MKLSNNLKSTIRVAKIELNSMFYSPVAWLIIFIFVCQIGLSFSESIDRQLRFQDMGGSLWQVTLGIFSGFTGILAPILKHLYLYIPLITMGLMSREYQSGSIKLLYSSPIRNSSIILGKFLSMAVYGIALLGILILIMVLCLIFIKDFDYPVLLSGLLGFYLLILAYSAIGIFMSSLTQYQVVAALGTLALLAGLNFVSNIGQNIDFVRDITYWISISDRSYLFLDGLISSEDVVYFVVVISFFLSLAIFKLNTEKTVMSVSKKITGYSLIILFGVVAGYVTSRPQMKLYLDVTADHHNTLSVESQRVLREVKKQKGDVTIVSYVNILSDGYYNGIPSGRITDRQRFDKYIRFMPGIKMEYVLYYDETTNPSFVATQHKGSSLKETAQLVCKSDKLDFDKVLSPEEFKTRHRRDLEVEGNQFIRVLRTEDGQESFLRMFNDSSKHPEESEITAAFSRFISKAPMVAFYSNNDARAIDNYGDRGYYLFGHDKSFRNSLLNHGFDTKKVDLERDNLEGINVLVISDLMQPLSDTAIANVVNYYSKGGNLFITGDYKRSENMNKLTESLGVVFSDGVLVEESQYHNPTIVAAKYTQAAAEQYYTYTKLRKHNSVVSANASVALDCSKAIENGFTVLPVLQTSADAWLEYETTDFIDGIFQCNAEANENKGVYNVLVTLERKINGKSQRIVVSGDSDIIANGELTSSHPGINAQNYSIINGSFRWLSDDVYPIDVRKEEMTDDKIYLPKGSRKYVQALFMFVIPLMVLVFGIVAIVRRQRK